MYCDLCVPLPRTATQADRARLRSELQRQGYHTIAFNTVVHGRPQKSNKSTGTAAAATASSSHRGVWGGTPSLQQLERITIICDNAADVQALTVSR
jgi:hypothetical protein